MVAHIEALYRYPVKGLSPEALTRVTLTAGRCLPEDRRFALALPSTRFDATEPEWLPKSRFAMLMRDEKLAELSTSFDPEREELTIACGAAGGPGQPAVRARLAEAEGCNAVSDFFRDFLGEAVEQPLRVVMARGHAFADARRKPEATTDQYVSLINRHSLEALAAAVGRPVEALRFRANVYFAGPPAWQEREWLGHEIMVGGARLRVIAEITRCAATQVNPATAKRDIDIPAALLRHFGHNLMGIYAEVAAGGEIAVGDEMSAVA
jgi:uncharacterized protein YcbX